MKAIILLAAAGFAAAHEGHVHKAECPPAGEKSVDGRVSCDPSVKIPGGLVCEAVDGCHYLSAPSPPTHPEPSSHDKPPSNDQPPSYDQPPPKAEPPSNEKPPPDAEPPSYEKPPPNGQPPSNEKPPPTPSYDHPPKETPSKTPSCPSAGDKSADGKYSCNPAHSYPEGRVCEKDEQGCYYLRQPTPGVSVSVSIPPAPTPTSPPSDKPKSECAEIGTNSPDGRYACSPSHSYGPEQVCEKDTKGCFYLIKPRPQPTTPGHSPDQPKSPEGASPPSYEPQSPKPNSPPSYEPQSPQPNSPPSYEPHAPVDVSPPRPEPPAHEPQSPVDVSPHQPKIPLYQSPKAANNTHPAGNTTRPVTPYTGGAGMLLASGAPIVAAVLAAFFL